MSEKKFEEMEKEDHGYSKDDNVLVLKRNYFQDSFDAGDMDKFITKNFGNIISRDGKKSNGVLICGDEVIIFLNSSFTDLESIKEKLEIEDNVKSIK